MSNKTFVCWSCGEKTPAGKCIHCGEQVLDPTAQSREEKLKLNPENVVVSFDGPKGKKFDLKLNDLIDLTEEKFPIINTKAISPPIFEVKVPTNLDKTFTDLVTECRSINAGLTPNAYPIGRRKDSFLLVYSYRSSGSNSNTFQKWNRLFWVFTILTILMSGYFEVLRYNNSINHLETGYLSLFTLPSSADMLIQAGIFSLIVISIVLIRSKIQLFNSQINNEESVRSVPIPIIPYFELGTLGNLLLEKKKIINKGTLFNVSFYGNFIVWLISLVAFFLLISTNTLDAQAAHLFGVRSILVSGNFEPLVLVLFTNLGKYLGLLNFSGSYTSNYLLSPYSLIAYGFIYLTGIQFLPIYQFNGGTLFRISLGEQKSMLLSLLVILLLVMNGLVYLALLLFFFTGRYGSLDVLNHISELPPHSKIMLVLAVIAATLSFPIPV